ncbi:hypothetical protein N7540_012360 [Penicillium herquei]|nr:hypothetical protein N7540_012360 [Penicillium herquei]
MATALDQAGSLFTGWIQSCWLCLSQGHDAENDENDAEHDEHAPRLDEGIQREMQVCHSEPHLVSPMKLKVYDDLPSPLPSPRMRHVRGSLSMSSWLEEGWSLATRASSMTISRKRHTTTPLKISGPSDFRRVQSYHDPIPTKYQPLQLSIHRSGNRLSDLPSFDLFQVWDERQYQPLAVPPRALTPPNIRHRRCVSTASGFKVTRKPVGSGDNRRSLGNMELTIEPRTPVHVASPLIPHFSVVSPVQFNPFKILSPEEYLPVSPLRHGRTHSNESRLTLDTDILNDYSTGSPASSALEALPQTPVTIKGSMDGTPTSDRQSPNQISFLWDSPSTASSRTFPSRLSSLHRPSFTPTDNRKTIASPSLPNRLSQWFFPGTAKDTSPIQVSLPNENGFQWERTRTMSGSTVDSNITVPGGTDWWRPNNSISSSTTGFSTPRVSLHKPSISKDKGVELGLYHPTMPEVRQSGNAFASLRHEDSLVFREPEIGVAF